MSDFYLYDTNTKKNWLQICDDDEDYDYSYMDLLSDNDDVDENMSVDQRELHNVENTAAIQIKKRTGKIIDEI